MDKAKKYTKKINIKQQSLFNIVIYIKKKKAYAELQHQASHHKQLIKYISLAP